MVTQRFRTDLVDVAFEIEDDYGVQPPANSMGTSANQTKGTYARQWGLVTGGITLPNPRYEWQQFFGIGVDDRNMLMPIRGRQTLEGSIPNVLLCHDSSRFALEQAIGVMFNAYNQHAGSTADSTTGGSAAMSWAAATSQLTVTGMDIGQDDADGTNSTRYKPASNAAPPLYIIIAAPRGGVAVDPWEDPWGYIGTGGGDTVAEVFQDRGLSIPGWNGKAPITGVNAHTYRICSVSRTAITTSATPAASTVGGFVDNSTAADSIVYIRPTLVQNSFTLASRFRADDGSNFSMNYVGNKVSRLTMNFAEGEPVNFSMDFMGKDMMHNIGEDQGTANLNQKILKYGASYTEANHTTQASNNAAVSAITEGPVHPSPMKEVRVTEQPYFFSNATIQFKGTTFARFRNFSFSVDNALDPRYYIGQQAAGAPNSNRQVVSEILEGRRTLGFTGTLDMDSTADTAPNDAVFLQWLLNEGVHSSADVRDDPIIQGLQIVISLERVSNADAGSSKTMDRMVLTMPKKTSGASNLGTTSDIGLVLRSVGANIAGPPQVHQSVEIDGMVSSFSLELMDNVVDA